MDKEIAIKVDHVSKTFKIPHEKVTPLQMRLGRWTMSLLRFTQLNPPKAVRSNLTG
jgi:hypothetical protein